MREVKPTEPALSVNNVKKVWGTAAQPTVEETKIADQKEEEHYSGANNIAAKSNTKQAVTSKSVKKDDKDKNKKANALFAGISGSQGKQQESDSDSDEDEQVASTQVPPVVVVSPPVATGDLMSLLDFGGSSSVTQTPITTTPYTPTTITTPEFGGLWQQNEAQAQMELQTELLTPQLYQVQLQSQLGFQVVEVIGNEVISAANGGSLLVHCRVNPNGILQFTLKARQAHDLPSLQTNIMQRLQKQNSASAMGQLIGLF